MGVTEETAQVGANRSVVVTTALIAAFATAGLVAINDPGIFTNPGSPWTAALEVVVDLLAVVLAMVFVPRCC